MATHVLRPGRDSAIPPSQGCGGLAAGSILYLRVEDLQTAWDELGRREVERLEEPNVIFVHEDTKIEEWMAFFADGEGNTLALIEQRPP